jgi:predicted RNase H-like HicB family nuclease
MNINRSKRMAHPVGYIELTLRIRREDDQWVGYCDELGTSTYGSDLQKVKEAIVELVMLHARTLAEVGELESFLRKHKVPFHHKRPSNAPRQVSVRPDEFVTCLTEPVLCAG